MSEFRKKPVVVQAHRIGDPWPDLFWQYVIDNRIILHLDSMNGEVTGYVEIPTLEGTMRADAGDWIIRGVKGELYPCKSDIFEATYEAASLPPVQTVTDEEVEAAERVCFSAVAAADEAETVEETVEEVRRRMLRTLLEQFLAKREGK